MIQPAPGDTVLLRNLQLNDVHVRTANRIVPGSWAQVLVHSESGAPLLMAGEKDGRRIVVLAFALHQSDLPLQVAYPCCSPIS